MSRGSSPSPCEVIVFSKNRALQLHGLLTSYYDKVLPPQPLHVIYTAENLAHRRSYEPVKRCFPHVHFIEEKSFREDLIELLESLRSRAVVFFVDDMVFVNEVDLGKISGVDLLETVPTLRLGETIKRNYPWRRHQRKPTFYRKGDDDGLLYFRWHQGELDWQYPLSLDGHIFQRMELLELTGRTDFRSPNTYEGSLQKYQPLFVTREGACYPEPRVFAIPWNRVQHDYPNYCGGMDADFLLARWNRGYQLDTTQLYGLAVEAAHQLVPPTFIPRAKDAKTHRIRTGSKWGVQEHARFRRVVIWGHKLHTHTHSYIHFGFFRAFSQLGFTVDWLDAADEIDPCDFSETLFITEGQAVQGMPRRDDSIYIMHNYDTELKSDAFELGYRLNIQVYTHDCRKREYMQLDDYVFFDQSRRTLYMPWATDLLPREIDGLHANKALVDTQPQACFVGSISDGVFGNRREMSSFARACGEKGIRFVHHQNLGIEDAIKAVRAALLAPALQGHWQVTNGYIPCRIFKNISYGQIGITNSATVRDLFSGSIVYSSDPAELVLRALEYIQQNKTEEMAEIRRWVRDNHTYLNRVETLLQVLDRYVLCS